jgi:hypothetical protein
MLLPPCLCPMCGKLLDACTPISNPKGKPEPGNFSVCTTCGVILKFDKTLRLTLPLKGEYEAECIKHPDLIKLRLAQAAVSFAQPFFEQHRKPATRH